MLKCMIGRWIVGVLVLLAGQANASEQWHCEIKSDLVGHEERVWPYGQDTFLGEQSVRCVDNTDNSEHMSIDNYELKLVGLINTGFSASDRITLILDGKSDTLPLNFDQTIPSFENLSTETIGNTTTLIVNAQSDQKWFKDVKIKIVSRSHLTNDIIDFLQYASLRISRKPIVLPSKNYLVER